MIRYLVTAIAFLLISVSLASAGPRCGKQVGNVCLAQKVTLTCCCRVRGGMCCGEQSWCTGTFVQGCICTGKNEDDGPISRVSVGLRN